MSKLFISYRSSSYGCNGRMVVASGGNVYSILLSRKGKCQAIHNVNEVIIFRTSDLSPSQLLRYQYAGVVDFEKSNIKRVKQSELDIMYRRIMVDYVQELIDQEILGNEEK